MTTTMHEYLDTDDPCGVKPIRPMITIHQLDVILRQRYVYNTQHYFTNRKHAIEGKQLMKKPRQFRVPRSEKLLSFIKYNDVKESIMKRRRLLQSVRFKDNPRIADMKDVSSRLYVEEPVDNVRALMEIHPDFFTVFEGNPAKSQDDVKVYLTNIRNYAMIRQQIGYRNDITLRIQKNINDEIVEHDDIRKKLKHHLSDFQRFLMEDYKKVCAKVSKAESLNAKIQALNSELLRLATIMIQLNSVLYKLDAVTGDLKMYRRFLIYIAPLPWREQFDETLKDISLSNQLKSDQFENPDIEDSDIDKIVEVAKNELKKTLPPSMYFSKPEEIMYLFRTMELQSRNYLIEYSKHRMPFIMLRETMKQFKHTAKQELELFQYNIDYINAQIERELQNEIYLKNIFFRILNNTFYNSVASPETLKLKICIDFVYEQIIGKCEEGHQTIREPMLILEVLYEEYSVRLDSLDFSIVNVARNQNFKEDRKKIENALKANKELKSFTVMRTAIKKAFDPPAKFRRPGLENFAAQRARMEMKSQAKINKCNKLKEESITSEEREALLFFTEWCEGTDAAPYLKYYYEYVHPVFSLESEPEANEFKVNTI